VDFARAPRYRYARRPANRSARTPRPPRAHAALGAQPPWPARAGTREGRRPSAMLIAHWLRCSPVSQYNRMEIGEWAARRASALAQSASDESTPHHRTSVWPRAAIDARRIPTLTAQAGRPAAQRTASAQPPCTARPCAADVSPDAVRRTSGRHGGEWATAVVLAVCARRARVRPAWAVRVVYGAIVLLVAIDVARGARALVTADCANAARGARPTRRFHSVVRDTGEHRSHVDHHCARRRPSAGPARRWPRWLRAQRAWLAAGRGRSR